ncbi:MAG TPA: hypothetical protein VGG27_11010 [Magnetospirillaceae bacterium]
MANTDAYRNVRLALGDADSRFCRTVTAALFPLGLLDVSTCHSGTFMYEAASATVDVVVCDTHLPGLDFMAFVQDVRQGRVGGNPFTVIVALVRDEGEAKSEGIPRSGIDEMLSKPINPLLLVRHINQLSRERKSFVMTPGYVGPSRRDARRNDGSDDNLVAVPNTLRAKVIDKKDQAEVATMLGEGRSGLDKEKGLSGLRTVTRMVRQVMGLMDKNAPVDDTRAVLFALSRMAKQAAIQHHALSQEAGGTSHVPPILERIGQLAERSQRAATGPTKLEVGLLLKLSEATFAIYAPRPGETNLDAAMAVPEIVAVVDGYLAKG